MKNVKLTFLIIIISVVFFFLGRVTYPIRDILNDRIRIFTNPTAVAFNDNHTFAMQGIWVHGEKSANTIRLSKIKCRKDRLTCSEVNAAITPIGDSFVGSWATLYLFDDGDVWNVTQWDEDNITGIYRHPDHTKSTPEEVVYCSESRLTIELKTGRVNLHSIKNPGCGTLPNMPGHNRINRLVSYEEFLQIDPDFR
jgi:hypothetical protein